MTTPPHEPRTYRTRMARAGLTGFRVAVKETDPVRRRAVRSILRSHGAHFTNFYGRFFTETLDPYEGPDEGDLPI